MTDNRVQEIVLEVILNYVEGRHQDLPLGLLLLLVARQVHSECEPGNLQAQTALEETTAKAYREMCAHAI